MSNLYGVIIHLTWSTLLKKIESPSSSSYKLPRASQVMYLPPLHVLGLGLVWATDDCSWYHNLCDCMYVASILCMENAFSMYLSTSPKQWTWQSLFCLSLRFLISERKAYDVDVQFMSEHSEVSYFLHIFNCESLCLWLSIWKQAALIIGETCINLWV